MKYLNRTGEPCRSCLEKEMQPMFSQRLLGFLATLRMKREESLYSVRVCAYNARLGFDLASSPSDSPLRRRLTRLTRRRFLLLVGCRARHSPLRELSASGMPPTIHDVNHRTLALFSPRSLFVSPALHRRFVFISNRKKETCVGNVWTSINSYKLR